MGKVKDIDFDELEPGKQFKFPYGGGEQYTKLLVPFPMGKGKVAVASNGDKMITRDQIAKKRRVIPL